MYDKNNIFAKILRNEIPCDKVYGDEFSLFFNDINPQAKIHVLGIPKFPCINLYDFTKNVDEKEPQTLVYQYHFSNEENKVFLLEIYPNNQAALIHMDNFVGSKWEAEFEKNFSISNFQVLGNANSKLKKSLAPFTKDFRSNLIGFDRVAEQLGEEISKIK